MPSTPGSAGQSAEEQGGADVDHIVDYGFDEFLQIVLSPSPPTAAATAVASSAPTAEATLPPTDGAPPAPIDDRRYRGVEYHSDVNEDENDNYSPTLNAQLAGEIPKKEEEKEEGTRGIEFVEDDVPLPMESLPAKRPLQNDDENGDSSDHAPPTNQALDGAPSATSTEPRSGQNPAQQQLLEQTPRISSVPILEATLVTESEQRQELPPPQPVYDAVRVPGDSEPSHRPWWRNKKNIALGVMLVAVAVLASVVGVAFSPSQNQNVDRDEDGGGAVPAEEEGGEVNEEDRVPMMNGDENMTPAGDITTTFQPKESAPSRQPALTEEDGPNVEGVQIVAVGEEDDQQASESPTTEPISTTTTPSLESSYYLRPTAESTSIWSITPIPTTQAPTTKSTTNAPTSGPTSSPTTAPSTKPSTSPSLRPTASFTSIAPITPTPLSQTPNAKPATNLPTSVPRSWVQQAKLLANDGEAGDWFGESVSIHSNTAIVGAHLDDDDGKCSGSAYIFVNKGENEWVQQAKLTATDRAARDEFGSSVAVYQGIVVIGASDNENANIGAAYVFERDGLNNWVQRAKLTANDGARFDHFGGDSVAIYGSSIVVGSRCDDDRGQCSGSAYIFVRSASTRWTQQAKLVANDSAEYDYFGKSVAIFQDTVIIGAPEDSFLGEIGAAYIFVRDAGTSRWVQQAKLSADEGVEGDYFGSSVGLFENTAIVGAKGDSRGAENGSGSAYIFERDGESNWSLQAKLVADDGASLDWFGYNVAIFSDTVVIGARGDNDDGVGTGSAYIFIRDAANNWILGTKLLADDGADKDNFGRGVGIYEGTILVGAYGDDHGDGYGTGSAYIFNK